MIQFDAGNIWSEDNNQEKGDRAIAWLISKRKELWFIDVDSIVDTSEIEKYVQEVWSDFESVVVFGMGGSALGTKALLEAAHGKYYNEQQGKKWKNIYVLDNIDPETISDVESLIDVQKTLFCFISKSGTTVEPLSQYLYFRELVQRNYTKRGDEWESWKKHFCFVIGENCQMREKLESEFSVFFIPENTGGRFSVFTAVWLLPLALSWVNIHDYILWIQESREEFLSPNLEKNIPLKLALLQSNLYKNKSIDSSVIFSYSSRLFQFGEWYKQLLAESIGKDGHGITPISSIWASDQHSELQLYQDGPSNKLFTFISVEQTGVDRVPDSDFPGLSFKSLLDIYQYGTETSLKQESYPVCWLILPDLSERTLWKLLYLYMFQIAYLGELIWINAFDQPWVEKSKNFAREKMKEDYGDIDLFKKAFYE